MKEILAQNLLRIPTFLKALCVRAVGLGLSQLTNTEKRHLSTIITYDKETINRTTWAASP